MENENIKTTSKPRSGGIKLFLKRFFSMGNKNLQHYGFIISCVALILSQFKPVYTYFQNPEIEVNLGKNLSISHSLGSINFMSFMQIINSGEIEGQVNRIESFIISKDGSYKISLPAFSYFLNPTTTSRDQTVNQLPFAPTIIKSGDAWSYNVNFFNQRTDESCSKVNTLYSMAIADLQKNTDSVTKSPKMSTSLFNQLKSCVSGSLPKFNPGEYLLMIVLYDTDSQDDLIVKKLYSFSLSKSNITIFNKITDDYQEGYGIIYPPQSGVVVELRNIARDGSIDSVYTLYKRYKSNNSR